MASKHYIKTEILEVQRIESDVSTSVKSKLTYDINYSFGALNDNDLINKGSLLGLVAQPVKIVVPVGTALTVSGGEVYYNINYSLYEPLFGDTPTVLLKRDFIYINHEPYLDSSNVMKVYLPDFDSSNLTTQNYTIIIKA